MIRPKDVFSVDDVLSGDITVEDSPLGDEFQVSFRVGTTDPALDCTSFLCTLIVAKRIFSFIFCYSVEEDCRSCPLGKPVPLSGGSRCAGVPHVVVVEAMFGLLEDACRPIGLSHQELITIGAIEGDHSGLRDMG